MVKVQMKGSSSKQDYRVADYTLDYSEGASSDL